MECRLSWVFRLPDGSTKRGFVILDITPESANTLEVEFGREGAPLAERWKGKFKLEELAA